MPIVYGATFPSWATQDMMFGLFEKGGWWTIMAASGVSKRFVMNIYGGKDKLGDTVVMHRLDGAYNNNAVHFLVEIEPEPS